MAGGAICSTGVISQSSVLVVLLLFLPAIRGFAVAGTCWGRWLLLLVLGVCRLGAGLERRLLVWFGDPEVWGRKD